MAKYHNTIIIGSGAAGLMAAYWCCNDNRQKDILILDSNSEAGRKINATGNGKCNFTNTIQGPDCYRSSSPERVFSIINRFDCNKTIKFFEENGIPCYERNGYCYPFSEQARSVSIVLENRVFRRGAKIRLGEKVVRLEPFTSYNTRFRIVCETGNEYTCNNLLIASGGFAAPVFGTDGVVFQQLIKMGLERITPLPALVGLKSNESSLRLLDGVRVRCKITLTALDAEADSLYTEYGEIIFNKSGISGIPVLNASRFATKMIHNGNKVFLKLDFFPERNEQELKAYIIQLLSTSGLSPVKALPGLINDRILKVLLKKSDIEPEARPNLNNYELFEAKINTLAEQLKGFTLNITGDAGFENAQTTAGGIALEELDDNLQSKKYPGLFLAGEILDVDGKCGGYNLQWAWSSGYVAGKAIADQA